MDSPRVRLNIGGRIHVTSRSTILKYPETMLAKMLTRPDMANPDEDGSYFFDRNPDLFSYVLDFYRTDKIVYPTFVSVEDFLLEMKFWGIDTTNEEFPRVEDVINFSFLMAEVQFLNQLGYKNLVSFYRHLMDDICERISEGERTGIIGTSLQEKDRVKIMQIFNFKYIEICSLPATYHQLAGYWKAYDKEEVIEICTQIKEEIFSENGVLKMKCLRFEF